jgi:CRP/FNR family transcriptional regulator, anaerobic regulatory protein
MDNTRQILVKDKFMELLPFLTKESFKEIDDFFSALLFQKIPANKIISVEGDACNYFSFLLKGVIRVYKVGSSGREITLYRINEGGSCILTASCILSHKSFPAIAVTELDSEVLSLPANLFKDWVSKYPVWQEYVFNLVSERLADVITIVEEIAFKHVDIRLAERLNQFIIEQTNPIELTHQQLASDIGTSREVVSRILKDFEARGVIQISRGSIKVLDTVKLKALQKK